jgi:UDP-N-acetylglucosamine 2-epimerase (non-hydrolysing)
MTRLFFYVGTTAELIKLAPVMRELGRRNMDYQLISSGQNDIFDGGLYAAAVKQPSLIVNHPPTRKTPLGLLHWFVVTLFKGFFALRHQGLHRIGRTGVMIVHGDTVTTLMGSVLGRLMGMQVAHVEAGLRSGNFFKPFPEELDRVFTSYLATIYFCPYEWALGNLTNRRGLKVNTGFNTNIDSLELALSMRNDTFPVPVLADQDYFIFIMHRQENLLDASLVKNLVSIVTDESRNRKCLFIIHGPTQYRLEELALLELIVANPNIVISRRLPYFDFIKLLERSSFIMTDGGGNQEECYYLGKPCLILREVTERKEGLGENALISGNDPAVIANFIEHFQDYARCRITPKHSPSEIIVDTLSATLVNHV